MYKSFLNNLCYSNAFNNTKDTATNNTGDLMCSAPDFLEKRQHLAHDPTCFQESGQFSKQLQLVLPSRAVKGMKCKST